jgi:hypothetical protein
LAVAPPHLDVADERLQLPVVADLLRPQRECRRRREKPVALPKLELLADIATGLEELQGDVDRVIRRLEILLPDDAPARVTKEDAVSRYPRARLPKVHLIRKT